MSLFKQTLGNAKLALLSLFVALLLSFVLNIILGAFLYLVPKDMTVFVPAHIVQGGWHGKSGQINDSQVYRFTYSTWLALNSWTGNGEKAYPKNLKSNTPYLSKPFQNVLEKEMSQMKDQGFLYHHSQVSYGVNGSSFNNQDVKYIGNDTWLVHLDIRTVNYVSGNNVNEGFGADHVASDAQTSFIFKVTKFPIIPGFNTSGLVIEGYAVPPKVVKVYQ